ncbi:hypothetical protein HPY86_05575 [candidate division WOR-3 bacterium]|jgi:hypothetical protein|nr:hypothetical protein [candidate division WOR-3 bacterium]
MSNLNETKNKFIAQMNDSFNLLQTMNQIPNIDSNVINLVYELSFLKMYLAWEWFIEETFILYMLGEKTDSGYAPNRYVFPRDKNHAYAIITSGRRYAKWLNLNFIKKKSELFFKDGEPFKRVLCDNADINRALQNMTTLRNAIVHISQTSREEYESMLESMLTREGYKSMLRNELGYASPISPGEFLMKPVRKLPKTSYIGYFSEILLTASDLIVR